MVTLPTEQIQSLRQQHYQATLISKRLIHDELVILRVRPDAALQPHRAGQYTTLGLGMWEPRHPLAVPEPVKPGQETHLIRRQYSISHPMVDGSGRLYSESPRDVEFYIVLMRGDANTIPSLTPRLFMLKEGDRLFLGEKILGHYYVDGIKPDDAVVLFSTGTGEAPHNYMLWELLKNGHQGPILAACCVRHNRDLAYRAEHEQLMKQFPRYKYMALTTREPGQLGKRYLQDLVKSGDLEREFGQSLDPVRTHVYLCGNPSMIGVPVIDRTTKEKSYPSPVGMVQILEDRGFISDNKTLKIKGNVHFEEYW